MPPRNRSEHAAGEPLTLGPRPVQNINGHLSTRTGHVPPHALGFSRTGYKYSKPRLLSPSFPAAPSPRSRQPSTARPELTAAVTTTYHAMSPALAAAEPMAVDDSASKKAKRKQLKAAAAAAAAAEAEAEAASAKKKEKKDKKEKKRKAKEPSPSSDEEEKSSTSSDETPSSAKKAKKNVEALPAASEDDGEITAGSDEDPADPNALTNFRISEPLRQALKSKGIKALFPIQATTFDLVLDGSDLVGRARTGQVRGPSKFRFVWYSCRL